MEYAYFSSMGRLFFSVLRGGGDEMGREGAKAGSHSKVAARCGADVRAGGAACRVERGGADLILSVDFTWGGYSDEKRRKSNLTATGCQIEDDTPHFTLSYTTKRAATAKWLPAWAMSGRGCAEKVRISEGRLCLAARGHRGCCGRHGDRRGRRWRCCLRFGR